VALLDALKCRQAWAAMRYEKYEIFANRAAAL
jgi:hypothetical protein